MPSRLGRRTRNVAVAAAACLHGCWCQPPVEFPECPEEYETTEDVDPCLEWDGFCDGPLQVVGQDEYVPSSEANNWNVLFLSEGFASHELPSFRDYVERTVHGFKEGPWFREDEKQRFQFFIFFLPADVGWWWPSPSRRPLGGCLYTETLTDSQFLSHTHSRRPVVEAARSQENAPPNGFDATVVVFNTEEGRADSSINMNLTDGPRTLAHELGHVLFGLGDEYPEVDLCATEFCESQLEPRLGVSSLPPNLTYDPTGSKWSDYVDGAVEGGARFSSCIYHPTDDCLMGTLSDSFCPVCRAVIEERFQPERERPPDSGQRICDLRLFVEPDRILAFGFGSAPSSFEILSISVRRLPGGQNPQIDHEPATYADLPFCIEGIPPTNYRVLEVPLEPIPEEGYQATIICDWGGSVVSGSSYYMPADADPPLFQEEPRP